MFVSLDSFCYWRHAECKKTKIPVEELNDGEGGGVNRCSRGDPVQASLSDVDKVKIFVSLQKKNRLSSSPHDGLFPPHTVKQHGVTMTTGGWSPVSVVTFL